MAIRNASRTNLRWSPLALAVAVAITGFAESVRAAEPEDTTKLEGVVVTGSRIKRTEVEGAAPVFTLERKDIERTGLGSVGDIIQQLTSSGRALNTKFNSSGNFGYPPEGGGIGAGSSQIDLRHLGSQRVLVLVDGKRWVNESSASGVGGSVDLNTIPLAIVERIEVLEDGASSIYGSDAIAGVVNVITRRTYDGAEISTYYGQYDDGDGETTKVDMTLGGGNERFTGVFNASYYNQNRVSAADRSISRLPIPDEENGLAFGSSRNPEGRFTFCDPRITPACGPDDFLDLTLNPGTAVPHYDPNNPTGGTSTFHNFGGADRFNYAPYNLVLTPNERKSIFASVRYDLNDSVAWYTKALYNKRDSTNQAAPEPIVLGPSNGTGTLSDRIVISRLNPYNPFGIDLDPAFNFANIGRRPLEAGPRIFKQDVDTYYFNTGLEGTFGWNDHTYSWDVNFSKSESDAEQQFQNGFNLRRMQLALGDPAICAANPGCVPLNLFGGQGANGQGTITPEMLAWVRYTTKDSSKQEIEIASANITGDLFALPAGPVGFAGGYEYRKYSGQFDPDQTRTVGESQDSAAVPTKGDYDVNEFYGEFNVPIFADMTLAKKLELNLAVRYSDYSNFGSETTTKAGFRWQPTDDIVVRANYAEGFRAPFIGELFGSAQFGASLTDPCGPINGPLPTGQLLANCRALGVPDGFRAVDTQITTTTGGNPNLQPESSDSYTGGVVYSPGWLSDLSWSQKMDFSATYYHIKVQDAIQAPDAQDKLNACVNSGDPNSNFCQGITRNASGNINRYNNLLANIGEIVTAGWDFKWNWTGPNTDWGRLNTALQSTRVNEYVATDVFGNRFSRTVGIEQNDGAIPEWQTNILIGWTYGDWNASWTARYISDVKETCIDNTVLGLCSDPTANGGAGYNKLDSTWYNDIQIGWAEPFGAKGLKVDFGVNNLFDEDPPKCGSCTLNGYDASTYEVPGRFYYIQVGYKFQ